MGPWAQGKVVIGEPMGSWRRRPNMGVLFFEGSLVGLVLKASQHLHNHFGVCIYIYIYLRLYLYMYGRPPPPPPRSALRLCRGLLQVNLPRVVLLNSKNTANSGIL